MFDFPIYGCCPNSSKSICDALVIDFGAVLVGQPVSMWSMSEHVRAWLTWIKLAFCRLHGCQPPLTEMGMAWPKIISWLKTILPNIIKLEVGLCYIVCFLETIILIICLKHLETSILLSQQDQQVLRLHHAGNGCWSHQYLSFLFSSPPLRYSLLRFAAIL